MTLRTLSTRVAQVAAAAVLGAGLVMSNAPAASAATGTYGWASNGTSCYGSYINGGTLAGGKFRWELFYSSANGGTNCIKMYNNTGVKQRMAVKVESGNHDRGAYDENYYVSYAGASRIHGVGNRCINFYANVTYNGQYFGIERYNVHCG